MRDKQTYSEAERDNPKSPLYANAAEEYRRLKQQEEEHGGFEGVDDDDLGELVLSLEYLDCTNTPLSHGLRTSVADAYRRAMIEAYRRLLQRGHTLRFCLSNEDECTHRVTGFDDGYFCVLRGDGKTAYEPIGVFEYEHYLAEVEGTEGYGAQAVAKALNVNL